MKLVKSIKYLDKILNRYRSDGFKIHLTPTMGALHAGHLKLVKESKKLKSIVVVSIFVNPTQFGPKEDYKKYPRTLKNDLKVLKKYGADIVFTPIQKQILSHKTKHNCPQFAIEKRLCGKSRPNYFPGVKNIVLKLFDIVQPDAAFFGEKDYQQYLVIKKMTESLKLNTRIICVKTVRDRNGLPLSSRNSYLSGQEFKIAIKINKLLKKLPPLIRTKLEINKILNHTKKILIDHGVDKIDYLTVLNDDLSVRKKISDKSRIFIAAKIGNTRLIDNIKI